MKAMKAAVLVFGVMGALSAHAGKPTNPQFCNEYAAKTANIADRAIKADRSCLDYSRGVHSNYQMHYNWCMQNDRPTVNGAQEHVRDLAQQCAGKRQVRPAANACPAQGTVRSLNAKRPATIHFANSSNRTLEIYWLDYDGNRKLYRKLNPGQSYNQKTFMTHPWIAVGPRGGCVGGVMQASRPGENLMEIFGD